MLAAVLSMRCCIKPMVLLEMLDLEDFRYWARYWVPESWRCWFEETLCTELVD